MIPHSRPWITDNDIKAVEACLISRMINEGAIVENLEQKFRHLSGAESALACGSGSQALLLALCTLGLQPGQEVILPDYLCSEVLSVIEFRGLVPRLVDVGDDGMMTPTATSKAINSLTGAILLPHMFGKIADTQSFQTLGIPIIEDCAHLVGSQLAALPLRIAILSFEATKLVTSGEGGMLLSRDPSLVKSIRGLKHSDDAKRKLNLFALSDLQASLLCSQLERLDEIITRRSQLAQRYSEQILNLPGLTRMFEADVPFRFIVKVDTDQHGNIDSLIQKFAAHGVSVRRPVDQVLSALLNYGTNYPFSHELHATLLSLPLYPYLTNDDFMKVCTAADIIFCAK